MKLLSLFLAIFLALATGAAHAQTNSCTLVSTGTFQDINVFSDCKRVTNNSGTTVCAVSQVDASQWQSFYNNPPSGVTIGSCPASCAGYSYGGYCYYVGGSGNSCDTECAGRGGCNAAGVSSVGTNDTNCSAVGSALGYPTWGGPGLWGFGTIGCFVTNDGKGNLTTWRESTGGNCATPTAATTRICACNN
jgi:hypothetical protein